MRNAIVRDAVAFDNGQRKWQDSTVSVRPDALDVHITLFSGYDGQVYHAHGDAWRKEGADTMREALGVGHHTPIHHMK